MDKYRFPAGGAGLTLAEVIHGASAVTPVNEFAVSEAVFHADARVNRWEEKSAFGSLMDVYDVVPTPPAPAAAEIAVDTS